MTGDAKMKSESAKPLNRLVVRMSFDAYINFGLLVQHFS